MSKVRNFLETMLEYHLSSLALIKKSDVMAIYGPMSNGLPIAVRNQIERLTEDKKCPDILTIILDTGEAWSILLKGR